MKKSTTAKRLLAVAFAIGITLVTNYAISFAEKSSAVSPSNASVQVADENRSGTPNPKPDRP